MDFTFGIITGGSNNHREKISDEEASIRIKKIIKTIELQNIPNYEIIIVGGLNRYQEIPNVKQIPFNEKIKVGWITRKKNIVTEFSRYENIVYMHDYFSFDKNWYKNMLAFDEPFDIMMNQILDMNGDRYHDWSINPDKHPWFKENSSYIFLPYHIKNMTKFQYISGGFWIAKKQVSVDFPQNENLAWGQAEDVEWSNRVMQKYKFTINPNSIVRLIKPRFAKEWSVVNEEGMKIMNKLNQKGY